MFVVSFNAIKLIKYKVFTIKMELENLKELGLSDGQISVYSAVLELGITGLNKIQEKTELVGKGS